MLESYARILLVIDEMDEINLSVLLCQGTLQICKGGSKSGANNSW